MQGASAFVLRARTPLEDAIASESSSELEGAKTATAEKFWHEAAPSKHNLALDKRKRRANKKGGGGPAAAGPGLATTVPPSLSVSVSSRRPPWSVVPVIIWSGRWAGAVVGPLCLSAGQQSRRRRWRAWRWHAIVARLTRSHSDVRTDHALLPHGPDVGPIRNWFRSMVSAFRITFARLAACGPMLGFGILSLRSGLRLGQKWGQFTLFHKFSGNAAEATARSTPLQTPLRKWDGPHADALVLHGWPLRGHVGSGRAELGRRTKMRILKGKLDARSLLWPCGGGEKGDREAVKWKGGRRR